MLTGPRPGVTRLISMSYEKMKKNEEKVDFVLDFFDEIVYTGLVMNNNTTTDIIGAELICEGKAYSIENLFVMFNLRARMRKTSARVEWESECSKVDGAISDKELEKLAEKDMAYNNVRDWRAYCMYCHRTYTFGDVLDFADRGIVEVLEERGIDFISALRVAFKAATDFSCGYGEWYLENQGWAAHSIVSIDVFDGMREDLMSIDNKCFYIAAADVTLRIVLDCTWESESDMQVVHI